MPDPFAAKFNESVRMGRVKCYCFDFSGCSINGYDWNIAYDLSGLRQVFVKTPSVTSNDTRTAKRKGRQDYPTALCNDTQT